MNTDEKAAMAELMALTDDPEPVEMELTKLEAFMLFQQLQLALKHPANVGEHADAVRKFARWLQGQVATTPALKALAEAGWEIET